MCVVALTEFSSWLCSSQTTMVIDRQEREAVLANLRQCSREPTLSERYTWAEEGGGPSALRDKAMNKPSQGEYRKIGFYRRL